MSALQRLLARWRLAPPAPGVAIGETPAPRGVTTEILTAVLSIVSAVALIAILAFL